LVAQLSLHAEFARGLRHEVGATHYRGRRVARPWFGELAQ
jgi:hypothetical protein